MKTGENGKFQQYSARAFIVNNDDWLYLVSNDGDVQCIKTETADLPTLVPIPNRRRKPRQSPRTPPESQHATGQRWNDLLGAATKTSATLIRLVPGGGGNADPFGGGVVMPIHSAVARGNVDPFGGGGGDGAERPTAPEPILIQVSEQIEGTTEMLPLWHHHLRFSIPHVRTDCRHGAAAGSVSPSINTPSQLVLL